MDLHASQPTGLLSLPQDCLGEIMNYLEGSSVYRFSKRITKSEVLKSKILRGTSSLEVRYNLGGLVLETQHQVSWPLFIHDFTNLVNLQVIFPSLTVVGVTENVLSSLPSSLLEIRFHFNNAVDCWKFKDKNRIISTGKEITSPQGALLDTSRTDSSLSISASIESSIGHQFIQFAIIHLDQLFPRLKVLELQPGRTRDEFAMNRSNWTAAQEHEFLCHLPKSLSSLHLGQMMYPQYLAFADLPNLTSLFVSNSPYYLFGPYDPNFASSSLAKRIFTFRPGKYPEGIIHPGILRLGWNTSPYLTAEKSSYTLEQHKNLQVLQISKHLSVDIVPILQSLAPDQLLSLSFRLAIQDPTDLFAHLPKSLKTLNMYGLKKNMQNISSQHWPPNLTSLHLFTGSDWSSSVFLPRSLVDLTLNYSGSSAYYYRTIVNNLPRTMTKLVLLLDQNISEHDPMPTFKFPPSLTYLKFGSHAARKLIANEMSYFPLSLNQLIFDNLPNFDLSYLDVVRARYCHLHTLIISHNVRFSDLNLPTLPPTLTNLYVAGIECTGIGVPAGTTVLTNHSLAFFTRQLCNPLLRDNIRFVVAELDAEPVDCIRLNCSSLLHLPPNITRLEWTARAPQCHVLLKRMPDLVSITYPVNRKGPIKEQPIPKSVTYLDATSHFFDAVPIVTWAMSCPLQTLKSSSTVWPLNSIANSLPTSLVHLELQSISVSCISHLEHLGVLKVSALSGIDDYPTQIPRNLKCLHVAMGVSNFSNVCPHLPPTLTELRVPSASLTEYAFLSLPESLSSLEVKKISIEMNILKHLPASTSSLTSMQQLGNLLLHNIRPNLNVKFPAAQSPSLVASVTPEAGWFFNLKLPDFADLPSNLVEFSKAIFPYLNCQFLQQYLPPTVTKLYLPQIGLETPLTHNVSNVLPKNLIELEVNGTLFNVGTIAGLPRTITALKLTNMKKWLPKHSAALPPQLRIFELHCPAATNGSFLGAPKSIRILVLRNSNNFTQTVLSHFELPLELFYSDSVYLTHGAHLSAPHYHAISIDDLNQ